MSDDHDQALHDLQATVEDLARRMGAGFREDLAQIRAICTSVAERDLTDDVRALRAEVAALAERDPAQPVLDELAAVRAELERLASDEAVSGVRADLAPVHATVDRIAARLEDDNGRSQVLARFQALEAKLDALAGDDGRAEIVGRLDQLSARLDGLASAEQVGRLAGDLRAHLADALGPLDGEVVLGELAGLRRQLGGEAGTLLEQLQDHLADVASGEVVGALWDEVRGVRAAIDGLDGHGDAAVADGPAVGDVLDSLATLRSEVEGIGAALAAETEPAADPAVSGLRDDVRGLVDEVRALSDAVATIERDVALSAPPASDGDQEVADPQLERLTDELSSFRAELTEGLVIEPSEALTASLDTLRAEIDGLHAALGEARTEPGPAAATAAPTADALATLFDELSAIRAGVEELRDQLEDGPVPEQDDEGVAGPPPAEVEVLVDQVAALRDLVATEVDGLREAITAAGDRAEEAARSRDEAPVAAPAPPTDVQARLDPAVLEELRDEIRAAGAVGDQVVDALREELKALRRRIAVKASEKVLDDDQLAQIADAVAARLEKG